MEYDAFISHASEDKESIVRDLVKELVRFGVKIWYDEFSLKVGDSLSRSIDRGLTNSHFGIVIITDNFLKKSWPEYELRGLVTKEIKGNKTILPILHEIEFEKVAEYSPTLADKLFLNTKALSPTEIAIKLIEVIC